MNKYQLGGIMALCLSNAFATVADKNLQPILFLQKAFIQGLVTQQQLTNQVKQQQAIQQQILRCRQRLLSRLPLAIKIPTEQFYAIILTTGQKF